MAGGDCYSLFLPSAPRENREREGVDGEREREKRENIYIYIYLIFFSGQQTIIPFKNMGYYIFVPKFKVQVKVYITIELLTES